MNAGIHPAAENVHFLRVDFFIVWLILINAVALHRQQGSVAEWSKALVLGTSPQGRGFESHRCQILYCLVFVAVNISPSKKQLLAFRYLVFE